MERADLGEHVRGRYGARYPQGSNLAVLRREVAAAFPTSEHFNEALPGLMKVATTALDPAFQYARSSAEPQLANRGAFTASGRWSQRQRWRMKVNDGLRLLHDEGRYLAATRGSHRQIEHRIKSERVTVSGKPATTWRPEP